MARWFAILIIGVLVVGGIQGCVLVVADESVAHDISIEKNASKLARSIQRDIDNDEYLRDSDIRVKADDGLVRLHGEADSLASVQLAIDLAARHEEVETIVSYLSVRVEL